MFSRVRVPVIFVLILLTSCSSLGSPSGITPTAIDSEKPSIATQALPPAHTPTSTIPPLPTLPATPEMEMYDQSAALLPEFASDAASFPRATRYWIEVNVVINPEETSARLEGLARIRFTNPLDVALRDLVVMLWPNDSQYQAQMAAGPVLVEGHLMQPDVQLEGIALEIPLPHALPAGETIDVSLPFWIEMGSVNEVFPQRFGIAEGVLFAPTFYPLVPRLVDGTWQVVPASPGGDTTNSDIAFYFVEITAPAALTLVASGSEIARQQNLDGTQRVTYVSGPMRDFALALGKFNTKSRKVGDVFIHAWVLPDHEDDMQEVLDTAAVQMQLLSELIGPYPYTELDVVDAPGAFGGIEYPGLVFIGTLGSSRIIGPTIHEVAHQWFYGLIGDDQLYDPWLDEAAATYAEALYLEHAFDTGRATGFLTDLRALLRQHPDPTLPIGLGVGDYDSPSDYGLFVYYKGALFFDALRRELGDRIFFESLQYYYQKHRYDFVGAGDFQAAFEETCDCDLTDLFNLWVHEGGELPIP